MLIRFKNLQQGASLPRSLSAGHVHRFRVSVYPESSSPAQNLTITFLLSETGSNETELVSIDVPKQGITDLDLGGGVLVGPAEISVKAIGDEAKLSGVVTIESIPIITQPPDEPPVPL